MSGYPRLKEMGVEHPQQIAYFSVNSIDFNDFLRVVYDRPKGSLRPVGRSYRFPRNQKTIESGDNTGQVVMESSPEFREALAELQSLVDEKGAKKNLVADILDELRQLEEEFRLRTEHLRSLIREAGEQ